MELFSHKTVRRALAVVFALGIVTAGFAGALGGAFGPGAQDVAQDLAPAGVSKAIVVTTAFLIGGVVGSGIAAGAACYMTDCTVTKETVQKIESSEDAQQKADLAAGLQGRRDATQKFVTSMQNWISESRSIASMKAKTRIVEMLNNGTTDPAVIEQEVDQVIANYYSVRERNVIAEYNSHFAQLNYTVNTVKNDSGISSTWIKFRDSITSNGNTITMKDWNVNPHWFTKSYSLVNGTSVQYKLFKVRGYNVGASAWTGAKDVIGLFPDADYNFPSLSTGRITDQSLSRNVSQTTVLNTTRYEAVLRDINATAHQMQSNYDQSFISNVAGAYERGAINTSDLLSPETLVQEWATSYNQTGDSVYKWATLSALGIDSPDLQNVSYINVSYLKNVGIRHVTLNFSGSPSASSFTVDYLGSEAGIKTWTVNGTTDLRVPAERGGIISISTSSANVSWDTRPDSVTPYAEAGESKSIGGVTVTVERPSPRHWVTEPGMLFAQDAPAGGFEVGKTYSVPNLSTSVYFAPEGQNTSLQKVVRNFTLVGAVGDSGQQLEVVKTEDYNTQTYNASKIEEQLQQLQTLRQQIEAREPTVGVGGGGLFGGFGGFGSIGVPGMGVLVLAGAALLILSRS